MKTKIFMNTLIITLLFTAILTACTQKPIRTTEPLSFKNFQSQKGLLSDKEFVIQNIYFYKISTNIQVYIDDKACYPLLITEIPIDNCISTDRENELQEFLYPKANIITCYISITEIKRIETFLEMKCGDKINSLNGTAKYPSLFSNKGCFNVGPHLSFPSISLGIYIR